MEKRLDASNPDFMEPEDDTFTLNYSRWLRSLLLESNVFAAQRLSEASDLQALEERLASQAQVLLLSTARILDRFGEPALRIAHAVQDWADTLASVLRTTGMSVSESQENDEHIHEHAIPEWDKVWEPLRKVWENYSRQVADTGAGESSDASSRVRDFLADVGPDVDSISKLDRRHVVVDPSKTLKQHTEACELVRLTNRALMPVAELLDYARSMSRAQSVVYRRQRVTPAWQKEIAPEIDTILENAGLIKDCLTYWKIMPCLSPDETAGVTHASSPEVETTISHEDTGYRAESVGTTRKGKEKTRKQYSSKKTTPSTGGATGKTRRRKRK